MGESWKPIFTHPRNGKMFVAINQRTGRSSIRVVIYDSGDDCFCVVGRNELWSSGLFTHWCCEVPSEKALEYPECPSTTC